MVSSNVTVITSICGAKDNLPEGNIKGGATWVAYLDQTMMPISADWNIRPAYNRFTSPRRNSRAHKILAHEFCNTEYSIWMDGNMKLLVTPELLIEKYLKNHDIAVFKHPNRDCIYDEALVCAKARLDDPEAIIEQVKKYEDDGFPRHRGQAECGLIIRRHTPKIEAFNNMWWAEYCRHSVRDQISFMYTIDRLGVRVNIIDEPYVKAEGTSYTRGGIIKIGDHLTPRAEK